MNKDIKDENVKQDSKVLNDGVSNKEAKKDKKNPYSLFLSFVINRMKEDKLYLFSFIVTVVFFIVFSLYNISESEGLFNIKKEDEVVSSDTTKNDDSNLNATINSDDLDVSSYVGIYSREIILDTPLSIGDACVIDTYKIAYQIKKDKSISKYFINDCMGNIKMWDDKLSYVSTGGARYIGANDIYYLFASSSMKEIDGDTFKIDDDLSNIKEKMKLDNSEVFFEDKSIIIMTYDNLYLINDGTGTDVLGIYKSSGGNLEKKVYKSDINKQFNFIVFSNDEKMNCYQAGDENFVDGSLYKIYTIKYNSNTNMFSTPKEIISRNKSAGCAVYEDDLKTLSE